MDRMIMDANKKKKNKIFLIFVVIMITIITLVVGTYAWFVGLSTVSVSNFTINISSGTGLEISLDGEHWHKGDNDVLIVNKNTIAGTSNVQGETTSNAYSGNTNSWVDDSGGLVPVSSSGRLDTTTGRLKLYEKSSLSSTAGGYRLVASRIDNYSSGTPEDKSYIAFDLFIRNGTENVYANSNYDSNAAENIYLKKTSRAYVNENNPTNYGAANSVRVGFFLIAGMKSYGASSAATPITGLFCSTTTDSVTNVRSLCSASESDQGVYWNVWEPNRIHSQNASLYFSNSCKQRTSSTEYSGACTALSESTNTYTIYDEISASDGVDIYDGLNGYTDNTYSSSNLTGKLYNLPTLYYPSNAANAEYAVDNQIFKLGGNSITKIRVYIWLEGQDPDNYDIISRDTNVNLVFGFTKDRYELNETPATSGT